MPPVSFRYADDEAGSRPLRSAGLLMPEFGWVTMIAKYSGLPSFSTVAGI